MFRGSPVCPQMFKNNVPQRKIGRDLHISPSAVQNIIKAFKEYGGISVCKGQGSKPKLDTRDLWFLRRHCIKNHHSSIADRSTWTRDYCGKPLSNTTIQSSIHKHYYVEKKPYVNLVQRWRPLLWARRHLGWTITQWKHVLWSDRSVFQIFVRRNGCRVLRTKEQREASRFYSNMWCLQEHIFSRDDNVKPHNADITKAELRKKRV